MSTISNVDNITIKDIRELHDEIAKLITLKEWLVCVKKFRDKHGITDKEAMDIAKQESTKILKERGEY